MPSPKNMRVLIVDDDRTSRLVLRRILQALGNLEVNEAADGAAALKLLAAGPGHDLCFLNLNMPGIGQGLETLKHIRDNERSASLKVCICSAVKDRAVIAQAAVLRPNHYILKPYSRAAIAEQVEKVRGVPSTPPDRVEVACSRLGINRAACAEMLSGLLAELRTLSARIPTLTTQEELSAAIMNLDGARSSAEILGAHPALPISEQLTRFVKSCRAAPPGSSKEDPAISLPAWLSRTTNEILDAVEPLAIQAARPSAQSTTESARPKPRCAPDMEFMIRFLTTTLQRGRLFTPPGEESVKPLEFRIELPAPPADAAPTSHPPAAAAVMLPIVDEATSAAIADCCGTWDLQRLLSFPLVTGKRSDLQNAIHLLQEEIAHRNEHGVVLLRQAVGGNLDAFLGKPNPCCAKSWRISSARLPTNRRHRPNGCNKSSRPSVIACRPGSRVTWRQSQSWSPLPPTISPKNRTTPLGLAPTRCSTTRRCSSATRRATRLFSASSNSTPFIARASSRPWTCSATSWRTNPTPSAP